MKFRKLNWTKSAGQSWDAIAPALGKRYSIVLEDGTYYSIWSGGLDVPGSKDLKVIQDAAQKDFESIISQAIEQE